ncbi:MAG TPA: MauE/DoxX family redox-associated membrane protein [Bryobacteraceae bacterium]|jgi:uncharacterized membrane protein YphA (DoxX/SURF4 family)|nr:MauE/DoxX family redox-associated membrane protein [Bryobacteraceae bacterium]
MKRWLLIAGRLIIAVIFLYAGYEKVREPWLQFAISVESFKMVPEDWLEPIARILPWCEIALGIALLTGIFARWFSLIAAGLLAFFLFIGIRASVKGLVVDCGCFGAGHSGAIDAEWFAEHIAMLALGLAVMAGEFLKARKPAV